MRADMVGYRATELYGDDLEGDDLFGDELVGDELVGDDLFGDDESGDDEAGAEELMGVWYPGRGIVRRRAARRAAARQRALQLAVAERRVKDGAMLRDVKPNKSREYILGFGITLVPAGATVNIIQRPQVIFRPERVVIPSSIGGSFQVNDVKVGKNSQFTTSSSVPAVVFSETSFGVRLKMDTAQVSMDVSLNVTNVSGADANFTAAIIGPAVE